MVIPNKALLLWLAVRIVFKSTGVPTVAHRLKLTGSKAGGVFTVRVSGVVVVQPFTPVLVTEKMLTPAVKFTASGLAIVPPKPAKTLVKPNKALLL